MHPDIEEALRLVTKHAGQAQAEKSFGHLLGKPTQEKALDERTKGEVLEKDAGHGYPVQHLQPDGSEDQGGLETGDSTEDPGDEDVPQMPAMHLGIATTHEAVKPGPMPSMHGIAESAKRRRGRPRKIKE